MPYFNEVHINEEHLKKVLKVREDIRLNRQPEPPKNKFIQWFKKIIEINLHK